VALAIILFDAGYATRLATLRLAAAPALVLASAGVLLTAVMVGVVAQLLFHFSFLQGLLVGIIVAPTDAAAVFFLLNVGSVTLRDLVRSTLEIESGSNDPVAIFLALAVVGLLSGGGSPGWALAGELAAQIGIGLAGGL
jgi:potassium/hydrogen antiporter